MQKNLVPKWRKKSELWPFEVIKVFERQELKLKLGNFVKERIIK